MRSSPFPAAANPRRPPTPRHIPILVGVWPPPSYTSDGQTIRPLGRETDTAFVLINALDATQQAAAIVAATAMDLVLGPGHDGQALPPEGIPGSTLTADQQALLLALASEWVTILNDAAAQAKLADLKAHLAETYFAWAGPTTADSAVYFRITGPTVHIEFSHQGGLGGGPGGGTGGPGGTPGAGGGPGGTPGAGGPGGTPGAGGAGGGQQNTLETGGANHIHTVYRDPLNDYGTGLG